MGQSAEPQFELTGGALCLDFANTLGDRPRCANETLAGYDDLVAFGCETELFDAKVARLLRRAARERPARARAAFRRALLLRERLFAIFSALAHSVEPAAEDLEALNAALKQALPRLRLARVSGGFEWDWSAEPQALDRVLWPVVRSAADLLTAGERHRIRECDSDVCSWLFIDRSRTRRRRWCDMKTCGNRAKARRHYERVRAEAGQAGSRRSRS